MKYKIKFILFLLAVTALSSFHTIQGQTVDKKILVGEWSQTNSPCQIKIKDVLKNGKLEVTYYNPKLIAVSKAHWTKKTGTLLSVYVELMDENFPGSNYKLNYIVEGDVLVGEYFLTEGGDSYSVEFVRTKQ